MAVVGIFQGAVVGCLWIVTDGFTIERDSRLWKLSINVCGNGLLISYLCLLLVAFCFLLSLFTCLLNSVGGTWRSFLVTIVAAGTVFLSSTFAFSSHHKLRNIPMMPPSSTNDPQPIQS